MTCNVGDGRGAVQAITQEGDRFRTVWWLGPRGADTVGAVRSRGVNRVARVFGRTAGLLALLPFSGNLSVPAPLGGEATLRAPSKTGRGAPLLALLWLALCFMVVGSTPASAAPAPAKPQAKTTKPKATTAKKKPATGPKTNATPNPVAEAQANKGKTKSDVRQSDLYGDRLDSLQKDVDGLKDRVFRSKARLSLLKETVLRGVLAGSRVIIAHRNLMGSGYKLVRIVATLDGAQIIAKNDETGGLDDEDERIIYDGNLPPGPHNLQIELTYTGHGYGVFSYLSGYTFPSTSAYSFTAPENGAIKILSSGYEEGNLTTEMQDRPAINWQEQPLDASGRPLPKQRRRSKSKSKPKPKASKKSKK